MRNQFLQRLSPRNNIQTAQEYNFQSKQTTKPHPLYRTMNVRKGADWLLAAGKGREVVRNLDVSPFQRIKRVQKLIFQHKRLSDQEFQPYQTTTFNDSFLKPAFKIKNNKSQKQRKSNDLSFKKQSNNLLPCHLTVQCVPAPSSSPKSSIDSQQKIHSNNNFQQIYKNRCKLQRRNQNRSNEVSLLEMLNRISDKTPLNRYKSRAFQSAQRVQPLRFQH